MSSKRSRKDANISEGGSSSKRIQLEEDNKVSEDSFLSALNIFILPAGIQKARLAVLKTQVIRYGGRVQDMFDSTQNFSHIIVEDNIDIPRMKRILKLDSALEFTVVKSSWLSLCLRNKKLENCENYQLHEEKKVNLNSPKKEDNVINPYNKSRENASDPVNSSDYESSDENEQNNEKDMTSTLHLKSPQVNLI